MAIKNPVQAKKKANPTSKAVKPSLPTVRVKPGSEPLPSLLQRVENDADSILPAEAQYLQQAVGNHAIGQFGSHQDQPTQDTTDQYSLQQMLDSQSRAREKQQFIQRQEEEDLQLKSFNISAVQSTNPQASLSQTREATIQRGLFERLGGANPRLHLPTWAGGYTPQQRQRVATRTALRQIGVPESEITILMDLHQTSGGPLTYSHADLLILGTNINALGGAGVARTMVDVVQGLVGATVPALDLVALMRLRGALTTAQLTVIAQAQVNNFAGARPMANVVTLAQRFPALTVNALADFAQINNVGAGLGEIFIQNGILQNRTPQQLAADAQAASLANRRAVANDVNLRSLIGTSLGGSATAVMASLLEGSLQWPHGSGPDDTDQYRIRGGTTFADWIRGGNEAVGQPAANAVSTMNCWEGVFFAAYLAGRLSYANLVTIHNEAAQRGEHAADDDAYFNRLAIALNANNSIPWNPGTDPPPPVGNIVFFTVDVAGPPTDVDKLAHVAVSLGPGTALGEARIMSLWNQPGNIDSFQNVTINDVLALAPARLGVHHAPNPW